MALQYVLAHKMKYSSKGLILVKYPFLVILDLWGSTLTHQYGVAVPM